MIKEKEVTNSEAVKSDEIIESEMQFAISDPTFAEFERFVNQFLKQDEPTEFYKGFFVAMMTARSMVIDPNGYPFVWEGSFCALMNIAAKKYMAMRGTDDPNH